MENLQNTDQMFAKIEENVKVILDKLSGKELTEETLSEALADMCPDISEDVILQDCRDLLTGVRKGMDFSRELMKLSKEDLDAVLPGMVREKLKDMSPDKQHQYLIMFYQLLSEAVDRKISKSETIAVANAPVEVLLEKIDYLLRLAKTRLTRDAAEMVCESMESIDADNLSQEDNAYSQEEKAWVLSAAIYAENQKNHFEKIPATLIGETAGSSVSTMSSFKNCLLSDIIPAAVGILSVAAVALLAINAIDMVLAYPLFASAIATIKTGATLSTLKCGLVFGFSRLFAPALEKVYSGVNMLTSAITSHFIKEETEVIYDNMVSQSETVLSDFSTQYDGENADVSSDNTEDDYNYYEEDEDDEDEEYDEYC